MPNLPAVIAAVEQRLPELKQLLPADVSPASFLAHFKTAAMQTPGLLDCTPRSVVLACVRAANDGLVIDGRESVIIVRNSKTADGWQKVAVYQRMYTGTLKRVRAALPGCSIEARLVFDGDDFEATFGDEPMLRHVPEWGSGRGQIVACYAIVTEESGVKHREVMEAEEINTIRDRSQGYDPTKPRGPWHTDYGEMAKKTVLNRLSKLLPQGKAAIAADADDEGGATDEIEVWDEGTVAIPAQPDTVVAAPEPEPELPIEPAARPGTIAKTNGGEITTGKPPYKASTVPPVEDEVTMWKARLKELRAAITDTVSKLVVEDEWDSWEEKYSPLPADVVTAAKGLIDKKLKAMEAAAAEYTKAQGGA